jgi:predicted RecB family nuclease
MNQKDNSFGLSATDLSNHLSCAHLTQLNKKFVLGELKKPYRNDPSLEVLEQRGREHEAAYVESLKKKGLKIVTLTMQPLEATLKAMREGIDVIVQARLEDGSWMGYSDILLKVNGESKFGKWSYEVQDTKLAQNTKAATILQLCLYSDLLSILQSSVPEKMYVVKPGEDFPTEEYRFAEFSAYYRQTKRNFENVMAGFELATYPDPVDHCGICRWWSVCDKKRHDDDHLSLVAGIRTMQIEELQKQSIDSLEKFANAAKIEKPERGNKESFLRKQEQAKVQLDGRIKTQLTYKLLPIEAGRGLNRLPKPNAGDIYFDIEGDVFYPDGGLEYLLGFAFHEKKGTPTYQKFWSIDRGEEKKAFVAFMEFVVARWKKNPNLYIYHFAPYEQATIKRLARVHAVYEKEIDELLRSERFIDLHAVFKEALLASVERYSLKDLEKFTKYTRKVELHDASIARRSVEVALELNEFKTLPKVTLEITEGYNEDDCLATEALHVWLENLRTELIAKGHEFQRPLPAEPEAGENVRQLEVRAQAIFNSLTKKLPEDRTLWTDEHKALWLLAHQVDYFRREDKSAWWEYYRIHDLEYEELLDERKAIAGLQFVKELPKVGKERNVTHQYKFPPQEISIDEGDKIIEVKGEEIGIVKSISLENNTIDIKKTAKAIQIHPVSVHASDVVSPGILATALMDIANDIDESDLGHTWPHHAAKDLLMKRKPKFVDGTEGAEILKGEDATKAALRIAANLDRSVFAIQGPPGAGKTYIGARMIIALASAGKKVGVTAVSHKVIRNLFDEVIELAAQQKAKISLVHKPPKDKQAFSFEVVEEAKNNVAALTAVESKKVVGGTAWLWADDNSREVLDYLFVDEAGQMSLSQVLAASRAAKNLILLGDPQQLEQPQKGSHPEGSDVAALTYLLDGHATMPLGKGLFLNQTRRLHPTICEFTSTLFYEGRLKSFDGTEKQVITGNTPFDGAGLFYVQVEHRGNQFRSLEEVNMILTITSKLLSTGKWTDKEGKVRPLTKEDILIVAPYNAQVAALIEKLPDFRIGTVDKFQGQEAPVVIYSMAASTVEEAPRGISFLFNPNRLNVATSRAKSVCILVASPKLMEPDCKSIDQMKWANAMCAFIEMAKKVGII